MRTSLLLPSAMNLLDLQEKKEGGCVFGCSLVLACYGKMLKEISV
jgi:hypothetical protein